MANWAQLRSGRMGVILHDDGRKYFVKPFDAPKTRENWPYSDVAKVLDPQDQADRRALGRKSKAKAQNKRAAKMSMQPDACPQCAAPPPSYMDGVDCPNCGYNSLTGESRSFRQYMLQFEWQGFRNHI